MPYFFAQRDGGRALIAGSDARHLALSLRARVGEEIEVVDPAGFMLTVRLEEVSPARVEGVIVSERAYQPEPVARITVAIANLPASSLELVLSRCTEAGAFAFHVFQADRSVARGAKPERWKTICREAAMLAGRLRVPDVSGPSSFEDVLAVGHPVMLVRDAPERLAGLKAHRDLTLLVGPEGGWSDRERSVAGVVKASLGPRNLRADTAALVGLATAMAGRE